MCAFCPGRLRRRNDRGRFNTSSPFDASVDVTDARGRVRNPDKPSRASGGLTKPPARALSRYRPIRVLCCRGHAYTRYEDCAAASRPVIVEFYAFLGFVFGCRLAFGFLLSVRRMLMAWPCARPFPADGKPDKLI